MTFMLDNIDSIFLYFVCMLPIVGIIPQIIQGGLIAAGALGGARARDRSIQEVDITDEFDIGETGSRTQTPILPEGAQNLRQTLIDIFTRNAGTDVPINDRLLNTIRDVETIDINRRAAEQRQRLANTVRQRGLSFSNLGPLADVVAEQVRSSNLNQLRRSIAEQRLQLPVIQENLRSQRLRDASGFLSSLPVGAQEDSTGRRFGETIRTGTTTTTGGRGGILGGLSGALGAAGFGGSQGLPDLADIISFNSGSNSVGT